MKVEEITIVKKIHISKPIQNPKIGLKVYYRNVDVKFTDLNSNASIRKFSYEKFQIVAKINLR